jgi:PmbA protein
MDARLLTALERHPRIHDWTARRQVGRSVQIYLVGNAIENVRQVDREAYEIAVFNDHQLDGEPRRGAARLPISRADLERMPEVLDGAAAMASLVHSPPWSLPDRHELPSVELADPALMSAESALAAAHRTADLIRGLAADAAGSGVRLSAAELFITTIEEELTNSRGQSGQAVRTDLLLEVTLLARNDAGDEAEYFRQAEARRLDDLRIEETVVDGSRMARDKLRAKAPRTRLGPVVICGEALAQLFGGTVIERTGALLTQATAEMAYSKLSRLEIGKRIFETEPSGDLITVRANALVPFGVASYRFDADGLAGENLLVIEDGVLRARPATQRYAQYLGLRATGLPGMAQVSAGRRPESDLLGESPAYQVIAFSAPNVDALTGDFGMEIRLGYELGADGSRPITGGSVTGNLFEALADVQLSSETRLFTSYAGPVAMRFGSLQVAGLD